MNDTAETRFWASFDNPRRWREGGPDASALAAMTPEERARVERTLLERLERSSRLDNWVVMALGDLRSIRAQPRLRSEFNARRRPSGLKVTLAEALWKISGDQAALRELVRILRGSRLRRLFGAVFVFDLPRVSAAVALGGIDTPESHAALERAVNDPSFLVRANAKSSLRRHEKR
jgi:hypothetical protein